MYAVRLIGAAVLAASTLTTPVAASIVTPLTLSELWDRADLVVEGRVAAMSSRWHEEARYIITDIELEVDEVFLDRDSSRPRASVTFRLLGGTVDGLTTRVVGGPEFSESERVIVFLADHRGAYRAIGLRQSKFVVSESTDGTPIVSQPGSGGWLPIDALRDRWHGDRTVTYAMFRKLLGALETGRMK